MMGCGVPRREGASDGVAHRVPRCGFDRRFRRRRSETPRMLPSCLRESSAQATVEMAAVVPVLLVLALIVYNLMLYASAAVRFDRVAADVVIAQGVSPSGETAGADGAASVIERELARAMEDYPVEVEVACEQEEAEQGTMLSLVGALRTYRCTMRFTPWPSGFSLAGVRLGVPAVMEHERTVTVDAWRPGVVV